MVPITGQRDPAQIGILIVDDEPMIAMSLEDYFRDLGFSRIFCAGSLVEASKIMATEMPDLAILDVNVGQSLVFPLADELRSRGIPFFFSSGRGTENFPDQWKTHPFVPKPASTAALSSTLDRMGFMPDRPPVKTGQP